jgi:hypothetical protein
MELLREEKLGPIDDRLIHLMGGVRNLIYVGGRSNAYPLNGGSHGTQNHQCVECEGLTPFVGAFPEKDVFVALIQLVELVERFHNP